MASCKSKSCSPLTNFHKIKVRQLPLDNKCPHLIPKLFFKLVFIDIPIVRTWNQPSERSLGCKGSWPECSIEIFLMIPLKLNLFFIYSYFNFIYIIMRFLYYFLKNIIKKFIIFIKNYPSALWYWVKVQNIQPNSC